MEEDRSLFETPAQQPRARREVYEWMQCLIAALIICVLGFVFVGRVIDVVGNSMVPTLSWGDKLVITRLAGGYEQGDIVVLRKDTFRMDPIVKRVIAVAGQTVDIDFDEGVVYVDGQALDEPYVNTPTTEREDFSGPVAVPDGCVFVMGDNRNASTDSRTSSIGFVDTRDILGKAVLRIFPLSDFGLLNGD